MNKQEAAKGEGGLFYLYAELMRPVQGWCVLISTQYVLHETAIHYVKLNNPRHALKQDVNYV